MRTQNRTVEQQIAEIGGRQWGVVTREDLLDAGISRSAIRRRVEKGLLIPQYPGVYRVGHDAPSVEASYYAAVRACGEGAVLSGRAAAHLWRLIKGKPPPPEVTTPTERRIEGIKTRRERKLNRADVGRRRGIPVTTVPRTLVDLAATLSLGDLARACHEAGVLHRTTPKHVDAVLARKPKARGVRKLRQVLCGEVDVTLSALEAAFMKVLREHELPLPVTNRPAGGQRVDCRWPDHNLTVELDSYTFHNSRYTWEQGYERERRARRRKEKFRRFTWTDVLEDPAYMLRELRRLLQPAATDSTGGRRVATSDHVAPASAEPKRSPDVAPK
jgi:hypothetical protein